jgi:hypothetical protein
VQFVKFHEIHRRFDCFLPRFEFKNRKSADDLLGLREPYAAELAKESKLYEDTLAAARQDLRAAEKFADHYRGLRRKYECAARYPWLPVAPEPLPPRWPVD